MDVRAYFLTGIHRHTVTYTYTHMYTRMYRCYRLHIHINILHVYVCMYMARCIMQMREIARTYTRHALTLSLCTDN